MMTFQSLIIRSEHGCIEDVRALCRTVLQACFRLAAIATDPTVVNRIAASASAYDLDQQRLKLSNPVCSAGNSQECRAPSARRRSDFCGQFLDRKGKQGRIQKLRFPISDKIYYSMTAVLEIQGAQARLIMKDPLASGTVSIASPAVF